MIKHLLLVLTAILLFNGEALSQCSFTPSISVVSGTNVCANAATLTALPKSDSWLQKTNFGGSTRDYPCGFNIGSKGYMGLGNSQDDFWEYDPATGAWTQKANYPNSSSSYHLGFSIGSKGYVAGAVFLGEVFYEYDPSTNTWTSKATPGGSTRLAGFVFSIGNKGYIGGGASNLLVAKSDFWEYTPTTNTWTQKSNFGGGARYNAVGVGTSSLGYAGLGVNTLIVPHNDWWEYDPTSDSWTQKTNYPGSNYSPRNVGFNINGKPYIVESTTTFGTNFYEYTPAADTWTTKASYPGNSLAKAAGFSIGSKGYMGGGTSASDFWEYNSALSYSWSTGAITQTISATGSGNYAVTITDVLSCSATATRSMNINPIPNITILGANVCNGTTTTLTASGANSYTWSSNVGGGTGATAVVTPSANTFYTISATSPGPCTVSAVKALILVAPPAATINGVASICGPSIALTAAPPGNTWTAKTNVGGSARWRGIGFSIGSKGYAGLGLDNSFTLLNDLWEYDPATNAWTQKANAPATSNNGVSFSIGNKAYAPLGFGTDFYEYNPTTNTWTQKANFPGTGVYLSEAIAFSAGSRGYMGLGTTTLIAKTDELWEYEPVSNTWTKRADFPGGPRGGAFALGIGSKGYVGGGQDNSFFNTGDFWEYTPSSDSWIQKASWPGFSAPMYMKSFSINNKGYFNPKQGNNFYQYDPISDTWTQKTSISSTVIAYEIAFSIGGKGYSGTGWNGSTFNDFYEYDPEETFLWSTSATTNSISVTSTGSYTVNVTSALGCTASAVKAVTVNPIPVITSTASVPAVCIGGTTSLSGGGASTYVWTGGVTNGTAFSPTTTLTYTVTGTAATGCTNTAVNTVTVNALPTVSSTTSNSVICLGGSTSLSGTGATTYTWSNSVVNGVTFSPTTTLTYTVNGTNSANGCTNTAVRTITVNSLPSVAANASPSVICLNASLTLSGSGASTYTWSNGVTNGVAFAPSVSGTYTVTGTSAQNCVNTATTSITVNSLPIVTASTSNSVICLGASTSLNGGGATSYAWSNGVPNATPFSPTITASYTVTGTDANTCTNTAVTTVTVNNLPNVSANASSNPICIGGTVSLTGSGATSYTWAGGVINGSVFSPTLTASYTVTGTDANTCTNTAVRTVTVNSLPIIGATASPSVICLNQTTTLNGTGASTYTWTSGVTNGLAFAPGSTASYTVTGTSALNCSNTAVISVTVNSIPTVTASSSNPVICMGGTTSLHGGGATTYTWSNSVAEATPFSPTLTASYTVTGADANTCTNTAVTSITVNNLPTVSANASSNPICISGSLTLTGGGATTYTWSSGILDATPFSPTLTASYTVTGTDANTCTNTAVRTITVNALPIVGATASPSVICLNKTTTLNGTGASTYTWTSGVTNGVAFAPGSTASYTVTGTSGLNCTNTAVVTVTVNSLPIVTASSSNSIICIGGTTSLNGGGATTYTWSNSVANATPFSPTLTASYTVNGADANTCTNTAVTSITVNNLPTVSANASSNPICIGGSLTLTGGGATTYTWSSGILDATPFSPTLTASYTVTGTDANTCTNTAVRTITVNALPIVGATASPSVICLNKTTTLNGSGATSYSWTSGVTNGVAFTPGSTASYTVTGTSGLNCTNTAVVTVTVNSLPIVTSVISNPAVCIGGTTSVSGAGASTYTWSNGLTNAGVFSPTITATYTVTGTDVNTCTNTALATVTVNALPVVVANASNSVICLGNQVTLSGSGASTYIWSSGVTNGTPFSPTLTASYTVTGTASTGCTNTAVKTITVNSLPIVTANATQTFICVSNSVTLTGGGASSYAWSGGVTNGVAFAPGVTTTYTVIGTSALNCTNSAVKTITVNALPPISANITNPVICIGGTTTLFGLGGVTYTWTSGVVNASVISPTVNTSYTVTGTDANSCTNTAVTSVSVNAKPIVTANASSTAICVGNTVTVFGGGATSYAWSNGITNNVAFSPTITATYTVIGTSAITSCTNVATRSVVVNNLPTVTASASNSIICLNKFTTLNGGGALTYTWTNGVTNGSPFAPLATTIYTVTGSNANSCTNTAIVAVTVNPLPLVTAGSTHSVLCIGFSVVLSGGGASTYTWSSGVTNGVAFSPVSTANYTVTGTDVNTCTNTAVTTVTVYNNAPVTANTSSAVICAGDQTTLFGGGAVTYTWTSGVGNNNPFIPPATSSYTVTGTDANGCLGSAAISVTVSPLPNVNATVSHSVICMNFTTSLSGTGASTYQWTGGVFNGVPFSPTSTNNYTVTGTNANGCKNTAVKQIIVNPLPPVTANASSPVICTGDPTTLTGGGANFYSWSSGLFDGITFSPTVTSSYTVTGMDLNSCTNTAVITITVNNSPTVTASSSKSVICIGDPTTLFGGGATSYVWTGGISNATPFNPSATSSYTVIGTAANGCTNSAVTGVTVNALPNVTASTSHSVICLNFTTSVSGAGAVTYTWSGGVINNIPFAPGVTATYSVVGTDANGCKNVAFQTVTVNNLPLVSGAATNSVICNGESTILNGSGAVTYVWTNGVINGSVFSPTLTLTYQVTGTDANTCSNTAVVTVTVNTTPTVTASSSHSVICMNDFTTLNGGGAVSYVWTGNVTDGVAFSPTVTNSYTVIGTSAEGCTNTAVTSITVNALPNVTGSATSPSICVGDITSLHGAGAQIYTWTGGVVNGSAFAPISTAVYTVTGTDVNGCINTNTTLVTVVQKPTITASVSKTVVCIGESVVFLCAGATSYTWTNGPTNGTPFTPGFSNSYVVIGSTSGCLSNNTVTLSVTVNTLPIVSVSGGSICSGGSFTLNANGAVSYTFSAGQVVTPNSTSTYSVFGTNAEGCVNITPAVGTVTVKALPVILFSTTHNKICTGQTATISAIGASTYFWSSGNITPTISVSPQINTVYSVTGTDANMCVGTGSIALTVVKTPTVNLFSNIFAACRGAEITLMASGAETYKWNTGDTSAVIKNTPTSSMIYSVTGTNEGTCSQTATVSVTIYAIPVVNAGADIEIQAGETAQLNGTQTGAITYSWTTDEGLSSTSILNPIATIDHDITYTLTVSTNRGCSAKDEVNVRVSNGLTIANYMTPNGDGKNDTWKISNLYLVKNYSVEVVNSWGKTVFSKADNYANEFDGQDLPDGVYYYFIKDAGRLKFKGSITITH